MGTQSTLVDQVSQARYWDQAIRAPEIAFPEYPVPSPLEEYLFDLQGFLLLRGALSVEEVAACNAIVDGIPTSLERRQWWGHVQREDHPEHRGRSYQQIYESGAAFEKLIDHPSWINYVLRFVGGQDTFDYHHGPLFIDENFVTCRGPGRRHPHPRRRSRPLQEDELWVCQRSLLLRSDKCVGRAYGNRPG